MTKINVTNLSCELSNSLRELTDVLNFEITDEGTPLYARQEADGKIKICQDEKECVIHYTRRPQFFKAFALWLTGKADDITLTPSFEDLGIMADCSRNGALSVDGAKSMIRFLAVMGYDSMQLYTEDTYEVSEYPYMGYLRGRYNKNEIAQIDQYASLFGIELIPCIQTLAHLGQTLRWGAHRDMKDIDNILLIDEEKTYDFIEACIRSCSEMFSSRRINIGMDEAYQVGMGKYLHKHGYADRSLLMLKHLKKVVSICQRYGFKPMMWSDMFFYLQFKGNYWVAEGNFSDEVKGLIPDDVSIIYWDYYSLDSERYKKMFSLHKDLHEDVCFAGGAWRWSGATPNNTFSLKATEIALTEAVNHNVKRVIATVWGDDGCEASIYSVLPTLQLYSDMQFHQGGQLLKENFLVTTGMEFDSFMLVDAPMALPGNDFSVAQVNPPKYMLFQDVLMGLFDKHVIEHEDARYFANAAERVGSYIKTLPENSLWYNLFKTTELLCEALSKKCGMGLEIRRLYQANEKAGLERVARQEIPALIESIKIYYAQFRKLWMQTNKVIGLEIQDIRYGGLVQRLESVKERLEDFASGKVESLSELEQEILPYSYIGITKSNNCYANESLWQNIVSANAVSGV